MKREFHHAGVPTTRQHPDEIFLPGIKLYVTDASQNPHRIEWVRFVAGCSLPEILSQKTHLAFTVENLDEALRGQNVIVPPFEPMSGVRVAFVMDEEAPVEYLEFKK